MSVERPADPTGLTRRAFLVASGGAAAAVVGKTATAQVDSVDPTSAAAEDSTNSAISGSVPVTLRINGQSHSLKIDPRTTLLDCLRETLALTGTKKGCDHGQCGACTVHVNGERV